MTASMKRLKIDITGQRFGRLTAIEHVGHGQWKFACDCGNTHIAKRYRATNECMRSCGCYLDEKFEKLSKIGQNDLYGMRFGFLVAIDRAPKTCKSRQGAYWRCMCDCGKEHIARSTALTSGHTTSCGCRRSSPRPRSSDLTGKIFGRLTVARKTGSSKQGAIYECLCECGNVIEARGKDVAAGNTKSCGCMKIQSRIENAKHIKRAVNAVLSSMAAADRFPVEANHA